MTGTAPERLRRRLLWAAEQLGLRPDASPEEVRAAWLRRLPEEDFVPSDSEQWALASLLHRSVEKGHEARADEAAARAEEERLREEVETFAGQFWDTPPDKRRPRWQELVDRCSFAPALKARLHSLQSGLDRVHRLNETEEDARVVELAGHVRDLFVLRPGPRARARQTLLRRMNPNLKEWQVAVYRLRRVCPAFASLGDDLLDKILVGSPNPERLPAKPPKKAARWPIWIIVVIVSAAARGFLGFNNSSPTNSTPHSHFPSFKGQKFHPSDDKEGGDEVPSALREFNKKYKLRVVEDKDGKTRIIPVKILPDQKSDPEPGNPGARQEKKDGKGP